jgi:peptidoglycan-N-acetylglucosamine deacetylase
MGALNSVKKPGHFKLTPFHVTVLAAILLSIIIFFIDAMFALVPLLLFALVCAIAPFMTSLSFFLPVISHGRSGMNAVALTFDDGPDPNVTPILLELLNKHSVKATFFVTGQNAERYPGIIRKILTQGHLIGNHSYKHDPILMLREKKTVFIEITKCQNVLQKFGVSSFAFRPPAGITNPRLRKVLLDLDMYCVNWSCRALDAGNRKINGLAKKILNKVKADDIILLHDVNPDNRNNINDLILEFEQILNGLNKSGLNIISLSEITGKEVMRLKSR